MKLPGAGDSPSSASRALRRCAPRYATVIGHEQEVTLRVHCHAMRVLKMRVVAVNFPKWRILTGSCLGVDHHHVCGLDGQKHFLTHFIHCDSERMTSRRNQEPVWRNVAPGVFREHDYPV